MVSSSVKKRGLLLLYTSAPTLLIIAVLMIAALAVAAVLSDPAASAKTVAPVLAGIDPAVAQAYNKAAEVMATQKPDCHMRWQIVAGIWSVESSSVTGYAISSTGQITPAIIGPPVGYPDTDHGKWDGLSNEDRAVGPGQFLPSTFVTFGIDANGDWVADPNNVYDAAASTANYLCGDDHANLSDPGALRAAIFRYNHSNTYVDSVMSAIAQFNAVGASAGGVSTSATGTAKTVIDAAQQWIGTTYAWGGGTAAGPSRGIHDGGVADSYQDYTKIGFDCSGLTLYAFAQAGISLPHSSSAQAQMGQQIPASAGLAALQPGDLVFWAWIPSARSTVHHVGIYIGDGQMINAPYSGTTVRIDEVTLSGYAGAARLL